MNAPASNAIPAWLERASYLSLATDRRDGREVRTAVWFARDRDSYVLFSAHEAGKVKRVRRTGRGRVAACDVRGTVGSDWLPVRASLLEQAEVATAHAAMRKKYGLLMMFTDLGARIRGRLHMRQYIRLRLDSTVDA